MKILVVEDEVNLNRGIVQMLSKIANCDSAYDGNMGLAFAEKGIYDLVILDIKLPKKSGLEVLKLLRKTSNCPVIILTGVDDDESKIAGLRLGADDYVTKPFDNSELSARCEAVLRRYSNISTDNMYGINGLEIDFVAKKITYSGELLPISGKQYEIIEYLIRNKEIVLPKEQIFNRIWGFDSETVKTVVDVYMSKIRKIMEPFPSLNNCIQTIKKVGYMWTERNCVL